jgi:hypothetical protein
MAARCVGVVAKAAAGVVIVDDKWRNSASIAARASAICSAGYLGEAADDRVADRVGRAAWRYDGQPRW